MAKKAARSSKKKTSARSAASARTSSAKGSASRASPKRSSPKRSSAKRSSAKAATRSTAKRTTARAASARKARSASASPKRIGAGRGATPAEIGQDLVRLCNLGRPEEVSTRWYHPSIESIEGDGQSWKGLKALQAKHAWWRAHHDVHSSHAEGPYVGATGFAVRFSMSFTPKGGRRVDMNEVGVYTVQNGKIVREEFMYGA